MLLHTGLYLAFIASLFFQMYFEIRRFNTYYAGEYKKACRSTKLENVGYGLLALSNICLLALWTYMCSKFSAPANDSRKKFLLVFSAKTAQLEKVKENREEHINR